MRRLFLKEVKMRHLLSKEAEISIIVFSRATIYREMFLKFLPLKPQATTNYVRMQSLPFSDLS